jgi:hypothetical protein
MTSPTHTVTRHSSRRRRRARLTVAAALLAVLALIGWAADAGWHALFHKHAVADSCQVVGESTGNVYAMDPDQLFNASIITDVAMRRALPERATIVALATALQESKLHNLDYGDADSLGLFQQRPSQGWGTKAQVMQPTYAAGKFFDALLKVPGWQSLSIGDAAQAVQRSAFPGAYADWEPRATALAAALMGSTDGELTCRLGHPGLSITSSGGLTLDAATSALTTDLRSDLSITSPSVVPLDTKNVQVSVSGLTAAATGDDATAVHRTATVAAWAIAHAATRGITSVVLGDQQWRPDRAGWHAAAQPAATGTVVVTITAR